MFFQDKVLLYKFKKTTFVHVGFYFSVYLYLSLLSPYLSTFGMSEYLKGLFFAFFGFIGMFIAPIIETLSDRLGRFRIIIIGIACELIALTGYILSTNMYHLFFFRVFAVFAFSAVSLTSLARINDTITDDTKRTRISGLFHSALSVAAMISPPIGALIADYYGYEEVFLVSFFFDGLFTYWTSYL